jgi:hypothetical protein
MTELVLWGLPKGSNDRLDEKVLYTQAKSQAELNAIKAKAAKDGWHSFRVQRLDLNEQPDFKKTVKAEDTKFRSGISVTTCPICNRAVVAKSGVIQPHADMKKGGWCKGAASGEDVAEAKDFSILDHPLAALAALLGILIAFQRGPSQGERNQEANYDLTKYRPAPREW